MAAAQPVAERYDGLFFVDKITAARPNLKRRDE